ncbi:hypothetical protein GGQ80_001015 [Sphingomonas jinjuensis]|uniref:Lipopolysaccharide assembly protein A domain-containing protein n=1 Tax=Sphingomonas jinjuensis TaxID=535907 RepID=A0A840FC47_9SPHN|nr:hypothetical protein [Sphingomonas jinjuensis]MBB4153127.1 hypothetical protein [Sphingomonas jinjuensis]
MQFLKILFWCLLAFVAALFTYGNWTSVPIQLWNGMEALVRLPFLLLVAVLAGFLPTYAYQRALRWRLKQRLVNAERLVADLRTPAPLAGTSYPADAAPIPTIAMSPAAEAAPPSEGRLL